MRLELVPKIVSVGFAKDGDGRIERRLRDASISFNGSAVGSTLRSLSRSAETLGVMVNMGSTTLVQALARQTPDLTNYRGCRLR